MSEIHIRLSESGQKEWKFRRLDKRGFSLVVPYNLCFSPMNARRPDVAQMRSVIIDMTLVIGFDTPDELVRANYLNPII